MKKNIIQSCLKLGIIVLLLNVVFLEANAAELGEILSGETKVSIINLADQSDSLFFYGEAGQGIVLEMSALSGSDLGPSLYLYRPNGTLEKEVIGNSYANRVRIKEHLLEQTGKYIIITNASKAYSTSRTGEYGLSLILIQGNASSSQDPDGGNIESGQTMTAIIDPNGDTDAFVFHGESGQGIV
ncbi:MAG: hypothetical protein OIN87_04210, partial [Candidatus Methanoperedens sp.]|nr:hypothetical protein [Candidatus Methanoperedens sp.]